MQVLSQAIAQGTVTSASLLNSTAQTYNYVAALQLGAKDIADTNLLIALTVQISLEPGIWRPVAEYEWRGGSTALPQVQWSGLARRVRLSLDLSRPVSVGATINQTP